MRQIRHLKNPTRATQGGGRKVGLAPVAVRREADLSATGAVEREASSLTQGEPRVQMARRPQEPKVLAGLPSHRDTDVAERPVAPDAGVEATGVEPDVDVVPAGGGVRGAHPDVLEDALAGDQEVQDGGVDHQASGRDGIRHADHQLLVTPRLGGRVRQSGLANEVPSYCDLGLGGEALLCLSVPRLVLGVEHIGSPSVHVHDRQREARDQDVRLGTSLENLGTERHYAEQLTLLGGELHTKLVLDLADPVKVTAHDGGSLGGGESWGVDGLALNDELKLGKSQLHGVRVEGTFHEASVEIGFLPKNSTEDIVSDNRTCRHVTILTFHRSNFMRNFRRKDWERYIMTK